MKTVLLLIILQRTSLIIYGQSGNCGQLVDNKCSLCLQIPGCAWCEDVSYASVRCNTEEEHARFQCDTTVTGNPDPEPKLDETPLGDLNQITPKKILSRVRVGEPLKLKIYIQPSANYPVDFYILMDLSSSMKNYFEEFKRLSRNISTKFSKLTRRHRLGFGSFVDKTVAPFLRHEQVGTPNMTKGQKRDAPCGYKHILNFTDDVDEFSKKISEQMTSGNCDGPGGTFDALMQVAACEKELGWNAKDRTRRMVLIATDRLFHMAGEGRFDGIVKPNDAQCWLGPVENGVRSYSKSLEHDYPTVDQIYQRLVKSEILPIFAIEILKVDDFTTNTYMSLIDNWKNIQAQFVQWTANSSNIIELIEKSYNKITSTVRLNTVPANPDGVMVTITRNECGHGHETMKHAALHYDTVKAKNRRNVVTNSSADPNKHVCDNVKPGEKVSFEVTVTATSCKTNKTRFELWAPSFGKVIVELDIICSCDCEKEAQLSGNHSRCNGNGSLVCGNCKCNEGWSGEFCQGDAQQFLDIDQDKCKMNNKTGSPVCDRNGVCDGGVCKCNLIPGERVKYYGKYCQCNDFNCDRSDNLPCGGPERGECKCGKCHCKEGFMNTNCGEIDCSVRLRDCLTVEDRALVNCSGHGSCRCGFCKCDPFYEGRLCDKCLSCAGRCGDYRTCVLCKAFGVTPSNATLCENCPKIVIESTLSQLRALKFPTECIETDDDGCTYYYTYVKMRNVNVVHVVENKDCPKGPKVLLIVLAVIGGMVGFGVILLILIKLFTVMVVRRIHS